MDNTLVIPTGMDNVSWSYELNVATFPTYAGEVVQILGAYIENVKVGGTVHTYNDMEKIYAYFSTYMTVASQGNADVIGPGAYNQTPMKMLYAHRGWMFDIQPLSAPGFRYARDLTAPTWSMEAHIVDGAGDAQSVADMVVTKILNESENGEFDLTGEIGYTADNPFSAPYEGSFNKEKTGKSFTDFADYYNTLIPSYLKGDFSSLTQGLGSKPAFGQSIVQQSDLGKEVKQVQKQIKAHKGVTIPGTPQTKKKKP